MKQRNHFKGCRKKRLTTALELSRFGRQKLVTFLAKPNKGDLSAVHNVT